MLVGWVFDARTRGGSRFFNNGGGTSLTFFGCKEENGFVAKRVDKCTHYDLTAIITGLVVLQCQKAVKESKLYNCVFL
jgi:hypothetical protein